MAFIVLPILYTIEHASDNFGEFAERVALTTEERFKFSDYGTLDTVPEHTTVIAAQYSRGLIDLNRAPDHPNLYPVVDFAQPAVHHIWENGLSLTSDEKEKVYKSIYKNYHNEILKHVRSFTKPGFVVAWHNTAHYEIGRNEKEENVMMKPFILSNLGAENSADLSSIQKQNQGTTSCDPLFMQKLAKNFKQELKAVGLPHEVLLNYVFKGGYVAEHYNTRRHPELNVPYPLQSFQVEYDTLITHDQKTLKPNGSNMRMLRNAFETAITKTFESYN